MTLAPPPLAALTPTGPARRDAQATYARLPLGFVEHGGRPGLDRRVRYTAHGSGFAVGVTARGLRLSLRGDRGTAHERLAVRFLGARAAVVPRAEAALPGKVNVLLGSDPGAWRTGLATFAAVRYADLWPGIDLVVSGRAGALKYELHVAPGADPRRARLAWRGARGLALGRGGTLLVKTPLGTVREARPSSWQTISGRRVPVASRFALDPERRHAYGFAVGGYDRRRPLVIDPALAFSSFLGGGGGDVGNGVAVDASGSAYVAGNTASADFPTTAGAADRTLGGFFDATVTKINPAGTAIVYSTLIGGSASEDGRSVALDAAGSAYVTGFTSSPDFPTTPGAHDATLGGREDAFVAKLSPDGSSLAYSTHLGGGSSDQASAVAVDAAGRAHATGVTFSRDFPTTAGAPDRSFGGDVDAFVTTLDAAGASLPSSTYLGGGAIDAGSDVAVDAAGTATVGGATMSADFPVTAQAFDRTAAGRDGFVARLAASGALVWSTYLGGSDSDDVSGLAIDGAGAAYATGETRSPDYPTTVGAHDRSLDGLGDAFVTKLAPTGSALSWSTLLGGSDFDSAAGVAVDAAGAPTVAGVTFSDDFPVTSDAVDASRSGTGTDGTLTRLSPGGSALSFSSYLGGGDFDQVIGVTLDRAGDPHLVGTTDSGDFPTTPGALDTTLGGGRDAFVTKVDLEPIPPPGGAACRVHGAGVLRTADGDTAAFGLQARVSAAGAVSGALAYVDLGPRRPLLVVTRRVTSLSCSPDRTQADLAGTARLRHRRVTGLRVHLVDGGRAGRGDRFSITLGTGYASGERPVLGEISVR